jgi:dTDP-4-amino-4,6-dideoxygalactose transaminase
MNASSPDEPSMIYLSAPDVGPDELANLIDAFESNWIAPLGPYVDAFEADFVERTGCDYAVALSSGTAALHLSLVHAGVGPDDEVVVPTLTFGATAFAVTYVGARPIFVDSETSTWNLDPDLLEELLTARSRKGKLPAAVIAVDLYGQCADYERIEEICARFGVPLIEDAAEALGASWGGRPAGAFGLCGVFSFNGNKIITTSGGGMLVTKSAEMARSVRHKATQAREPVAHYEHREIGYNYRLSNLLAAVGRAQLSHLDEKIARRRGIRERYCEEFGGSEGWAFNPIDERGTPNHWMTVAQIDPATAGTDRVALMEALATERIETRPAWKPMHLQPVFSECEMVGGAVAEGIFDRGLCLPSGSGMTNSELDRTIEALKRASK